MAKPKILFLDIETLPNICFAFDLYSYKKPDMIVSEKAIITFAYKWAGDKSAKVLIADKPYDDKKLVQSIIELLTEADYVVAHYGDKFDMRFIRARAVINGLKPPPNVPQIDTYKLVKKYFLFNANRLDYIGKVLGVGRKIKTSWELWERCAAGDETAIKAMARYNKQDVQLLEKVFNRIKAHVETRINHGLFTDKEGVVCESCGSHKVQKRGYLVNKVVKRQRYQCRDCGSWFSTKMKDAL